MSELETYNPPGLHSLFYRGENWGFCQMTVSRSPVSWPELCPLLQDRSSDHGWPGIFPEGGQHRELSDWPSPCACVLVSRQNSSMMTSSLFGRPSGQPNTCRPPTMSCSSRWRWWRSTVISSWRTTWISQTSSNFLMVSTWPGSYLRGAGFWRAPSWGLERDGGSLRLMHHEGDGGGFSPLLAAISKWMS